LRPSRLENKVSLGFVEGAQQQDHRVIQRRAYGLRDEDYLSFLHVACPVRWGAG
jgi:transposase